MPIKCIQVKDFNESIHTQLSKPSKYGCDACVADSCPTCVKKHIPCSCWDRLFDLGGGNTQIIGIPNKLNISVTCCVNCNGTCCEGNEQCLYENSKSLPSGSVRTGGKVCCAEGQECGEDCCPDGEQCGADGKCCITDCCDCCFCVGPIISMGELQYSRVSCVAAALDPVSACASSGIDFLGQTPEIIKGFCCGGGPNNEKCVYAQIRCEP